MSIFQKIKDLDKKFAWSFFSFLLAVIFGMITVHDRFIADKHAQIYLDLLTNASVFDIKEDMPKLNVFYDNINIRKQEKVLSIVAIKVINDSSQDILKSYYDADDAFGLRINEGEIIKSEITEFSNDYLTRNLHINTSDNREIYFKPVVLDAHQFFIVKLLVLHPAKASLTIQAIGHIAGMSQIPVREIYKDIGRESFVAKSFKGEWQVQLIRIPSYFILFFIVAFIVVIVFIVPPILISEKISKQKRKGIIRRFRTSVVLNYNSKDEFMFNLYVENGSPRLLAINSLLNDAPSLNTLCKKYSSNKFKKREHEIFPDLEGLSLPVGPATIEQLIENEIIIEQDKKYRTDKHVIETFDQFVKYLKSNKLLEKARVNPRLVSYQQEVDDVDSKTSGTIS